MPGRSTDPKRWARIKRLFAQAVELGPAARVGLLETACRGDRELRAEVESLLVAEAAAPSFLDHDAVAVASPAFAKRTPEPGALAGRRISHYELQSLVGAGGMGEVYRAHDTALGRSVAVKVLAEEFRPETRRRLLREAWASARLQHPAIATFYDAGRAKEVDYIAMELVEGITLRQRLEQGELAPDESIHLIESLLEGLAHAHAAGILHRDIKPENLMLTESGGVKLLDFGLAREAAAPDAGTPPPLDTDSKPNAGVPGQTHAGAVMGTAGYMAPEQVLGSAVDARADLFAVGAVLLEALTGQPAFGGKTARARRQATLGGAAEPALPGDLGRVVLKALATDPADRYRNATDFLEELRAAAGTDERCANLIRVAALGFAAADWQPGGLLDEISRGGRITLLPRHRVTVALAGDPQSQTRDVSPIEAGRRLGCEAVLRRVAPTTESLGGSQLKLHEATTGALLHQEVCVADGTARAAERLTAAVLAAFPRRENPDAESTAHEEVRLFSRAQRLGLSGDRADLRMSRDLALEVVARNPAHAPALTELGRVHAMSHNFTGDPSALDAALRYTRRAVSAEPLLAEAHMWLGYSQLRAAEYAAAESQLRRAGELDPAMQQVWYFRAGLYLLVIHPPDLNDLAERAGAPAARSDLHTWRRAQARKLLQRAIQLDPLYAWGWLSLGWCHLELEDFDEAQWCLRRSLELEPTVKLPTAGVAGYLGESLRRAGSYDAAREAFLAGMRALEGSDNMYRDTWLGLFLCGMGLCALETDNESAARSSFDQARQLLQGRSKARGGGQIMVQALAGIAAVDGSRAIFADALELFRERATWDFGWVWGCSDDVSALALARAAGALGDSSMARSLLQEAADLGSLEARRELTSIQGVDE